jgi:L-alanine-DL-glutamate epimerase-like enolase superfamily enzyme
MSIVLRESSRLVIGQPVSEWRKMCESLSRTYPGHPTAVSAMECALLDAWCRSEKMPLARFFGKREREIETYCTVSALKTEECKKILKKMSKNGFRKFKVKVTGKNSSEDFKRVRLARDASEGEPLIVDANQGWDKRTCLEFIRRMHSEKIPVALIEQPLYKEDIAGLRFVKERSGISIAADESFRNLNDVRRIVEEDAADVFNVKIAKTGLLEALKIARFLKKAGKRLMIGCMMESAAGLSTAVQWACGWGGFDFVDLDSFLLLRTLPFQSGFHNRGPFLSLRKNVTGSGTEIPQ